MTFQMDYSSAKDAIIRKFTNYRNNRRRNATATVDEGDLLQAMKTAASALFDLKAFSNGRELFKKRMQPEIVARRSEILREKPNTHMIAAFQMAFKEMWERADKDLWEQRAGEESENIFE